MMKTLTRSVLMLSAALTLPASFAVAQVTGVAPVQRASAQAAAFTDPANAPADLARIDAAMNSTGTFQGRFTQTASDGSMATGAVWLQRPGKMRFEYDAPATLVMISDGVTLLQRDTALETADRVPLSATPLNYFLKENINLANDTEVVALQKFADQWRVTARDGSGEMDGAITLVLDAQTLALREWIIADAFGGQTRVALSNLQYNGRVDPKLFILRGEEDDRRNRRR